MSPAWFTSTKQCVNIKLPVGTGLFPGISSLESWWNPTSHNPENGSYLWQVAPGQEPISSSGAASGDKIYEATDQGAQFMEWKVNLTLMTSQKGYQWVQSTMLNKSGWWDLVNDAHQIPSILLILLTMGNTCKSMELHTFMTAFFHHCPESIQFFWLLHLHND